MPLEIPCFLMYHSFKTLCSHPWKFICIEKAKVFKQKWALMLECHDVVNSKQTPMIPFSDFKFDYFPTAKWAGTFGGVHTVFLGYCNEIYKQNRSDRNSTFQAEL